MRVQKVGFQNQEDDPQRKRVAQRTFWVREHTQTFDEGHIRCRICYVSLLIVNKVRFLKLPLPMRVQKVAFQDQENDPQRKRVAQRTFCVREHTQAFDGGHIRCRISYVSIPIVIKVRFLKLPLNLA